MYNSAAFAEHRPEVLHTLIRDYPLSSLISTYEGKIECSHIPMVLDAENNCLRAHLARANPHWKTLTNADVLVVFHGPEHYVTPSWYPAKQEHGKVVPTWNYVVVHVRGRARVIQDPSFLLRNVSELTAQNETHFPEPWAVSDAPEDYIHGLTRSIVGLEVAITGIEGKWKLNQNRPAEDRTGVKTGLDKLATNRSVALLRTMEKLP